MHYKNGREAKVGDIIVSKDCNGTPTSGVVIKTQPGSTSCNLIITPITNQLWVTAGDAMHIDDALATPAPAQVAA